MAVQSNACAKIQGAGVAAILALTAVGTAQADPVNQAIDPRGSYLFVDLSGRFGDPDVKIAPTTISLSSLNFSSKIPLASQRVALQARGSFYFSYHDDERGYRFPGEGSAGVFQGEGGVISPSGGTYGTVISPPTLFAGIPTDIPQDFYIPRADTLSRVSPMAIVQVPAGATSIAIAPPDSYYADNAVKPGEFYRVSAFTFQDALTAFGNELSIDPRDGGMEAFFLPALPMSLQDAANLGGYDHFNYLQHITAFEKDGVKRDSISIFGLDILGRDIGLDPLLGGNSFLQPADDMPFYWDEYKVFGASNSWIFNSENTDFSQNNVRFADFPNLIQAGWSAYFTTSLVGVRSDGTYDVLSENYDDANAFTFRWKYTQTSTVPGEGLGSVVANADPELGGRGEVTFLGFGARAAIPEPSTWGMMIGGFLASGAMLRRRRGSSAFGG